MRIRIIFSALIILIAASCHGQQLEHLLLSDLKAKIADNTYPNIDGIIVELGNHIIIEEYFNKYDRGDRHDTRSAFKSVTSLLAGIAVDQKLISLEDNLGKFFPELRKQRKGTITVKDLLEMRSGYACEEFYDIGPVCEDDMWDTNDWIDYCINIGLKDTPGLNWSYNSNDPMIMGEIISRASGMTIMEFARINLFEPLGIVDYKWTISPKGRGVTAGSFFMLPSDMLKISRLVSDSGRWNNRQVVSKPWIQQSTTCEIDIDFSFARYSRIPHAKYESAKYGYYWYKEQLQHKDINAEVLFASGNGGQYMMILPDYDAKVVFTGSNFGNWRGKLPFEILLKYIIPIIESKRSG